MGSLTPLNSCYPVGQNCDQPLLPAAEHFPLHTLKSRFLTESATGIWGKEILFGAGGGTVLHWMFNDNASNTPQSLWLPATHPPTPAIHTQLLPRLWVLPEDGWWGPSTPMCKVHTATTYYMPWAQIRMKKEKGNMGNGAVSAECWLPARQTPRVARMRRTRHIQLSHLQTQYVFISPNICSFAFWSLQWLKIRGMKRENITNSKFVSDCLSWNVISVSQMLEGILVDGIPWMNHRIYVRHSWEVLRHTLLPLRGLVNYRRMKTETARYTVWRPEFTRFIKDTKCLSKL